MSLRYCFKQAQKLLSELSSEDTERIQKVCDIIQEAENRLGYAARENLNRCYNACEGICCKNVDIQAVISHWDFVYLLAANPSLEKIIEPCLENENRFYPADCIFLANGTGPCIFPGNLRPEVCITAFCTETPQLSGEIRQVKSAFRRLTRIVLFARFRRVAAKFFPKRKSKALP